MSKSENDKSMAVRFFINVVDSSDRRKRVNKKKVLIESIYRSHRATDGETVRLAAILALSVLLKDIHNEFIISDCRYPYL